VIRQQTGENRTHRVFLTDDDGLPLTGLTPTALAWRASDGASLPAPAVEEVGGGFYRVLTGAIVADAVIRVDRGSPGAGRYVALEVIVGGYVDSLDATVSSRATAAAVAALGAPAQGADLVSVQAVLVAAVDALGTPAQDVALDAARVELLALIGTRATPDDVGVELVPVPGVRTT
jgi:hypothetical protein